MIKPNDRFGFLKTLRPERENGRSYWWVKCVCGKEKRVQYSQLHGATRPIKSCGCKRLSLLSKAQTTHGCSLRDAAGFPTFISWQSMIWRCYNKAREDYQNYGGRGIKVCERWLKFENFLADMGHKPKHLSLGRINNEKGYSPSNCRWETPTQQARNKRTNTLLYFKGQRRTLAECAELTGIERSTIGKRLEAGWGVGDALTRRVA